MTQTIGTMPPHPPEHSHEQSHTHAHAYSLQTFDRAMALGVSLNGAFVIAEIAGGMLAGSLSLVADAGHNAGDVIGLLLAWGASWLARRPPTPRYTWGLRRSTIYAAIANATLLLTACGVILWEACHRLWAPEPVAGTVVIVVAAIGVAINTLTAMLFMQGSKQDANLRGAYLHMAADAAVSTGVVLAGILIATTGLVWIDPVVSIAITLVIVASTWGLFRESIDLALDAVPKGIESESVRSLLAGIPGVVDVHELHIWNASTSEISLTVHLVVPNIELHEGVLLQSLQELRRHCGVAHTTIQIERSNTCCTC